MKAFVVIILGLLVALECSGLELTKDQYDNLDYIHGTLKAKYPQFVGFNGSMSKMNVIGISEAAAIDEMKKINFDQVNAEKYEKEQEVAAIKAQMVDDPIKSYEATVKKLKYKDYVKQKLSK